MHSSLVTTLTLCDLPGITLAPNVVPTPNVQRVTPSFGLDLVVVVVIEDGVVGVVFVGSLRLVVSIVAWFEFWSVGITS